MYRYLTDDLILIDKLITKNNETLGDVRVCKIERKHVSCISCGSGVCAFAYTMLHIWKTVVTVANPTDVCHTRLPRYPDVTKHLLTSRSIWDNSNDMMSFVQSVRCCRTLG